MTGGQISALRVAGVVGGAGTSTLVRLLRLAFPRHPVVDLGRYQGGEVDVLVTNNTVDSVRVVGDALAANPRRPVLVMMRTVPGVVHNTKPHMINISPNISALFEVNHRRAWVEMAGAPGTRLPRGKGARDLANLVTNLPGAIAAMFAQPPRFGPASRTAPVRALPPRSALPGVGMPAMPGAHGVPAVGARAGPDTRKWPTPNGAPHHAFRGSQGG
ncbi:hypothetical protein [Saccharothrix sp.]|uniref:hypothetical protein n=1 Tax=Saccharothrix sp. TaxID=1873460 RepID=UPI00281134C9|nr:hypothetical protein [Saccharothrix sp.]